jgi:hypothetical protein
MAFEVWYKWLSIEMREQRDNPLGAIKDAVRIVQKIYGLR